MRTQIYIQGFCMICLKYKLIIIEMSRGLFSALSALTIVTGTAAIYFLKKITTPSTELIDRLVIKKILIKLRKRAYSTLREIAFIVNNIRTLEGDLQVKKISEIFMRDGGSGEKKLHAIEALVLGEEQISQKDFEYSCNHYCDSDIEIKILLDTFRKDLNMALQGVIESYMGPLPRFQPEKILKMQQHILKSKFGDILRAYGCNMQEVYVINVELRLFKVIGSNLVKSICNVKASIIRNNQTKKYLWPFWSIIIGMMLSLRNSLNSQNQIWKFIIEMDNTSKKKKEQERMRKERKQEEVKSESEEKMDLQKIQEKQADLKMNVKEKGHN